MFIIRFSCLYIFLLFVLSCGFTVTEIRKPKTRSATRQGPSRKTVSKEAPGKTFVVTYKKAVEMIDPKKVFGTYLVQDALWLEKHQLFVNQEFDFAMAIGAPGVGAGIAAQKRQKANRKVSDQLASVPSVNLQQVFETSLSRYQDLRQKPFHATVSLYGLLFGDKKARLQSILEVAQPTDNPGDDDTRESASVRFIYVSCQKALTGEASWTSDNGAALIEAMQIGAEELVSRFYEHMMSMDELSSAVPADKPTGKCPVGGNQNVTGKILKKQGERTIMRLDGPQLTLLSCDSAGLLQ